MFNMKPQAISLVSDYTGAGSDNSAGRHQLTFGVDVRCTRCKGKGEIFFPRLGRKKPCYLCHGKGIYQVDGKKGRI
jgi:DnaJ-class molecular chaperone